MSGDNKLFVEGELDSNLLGSLPLSGWTVQALKDGGKGALKPRTKSERDYNTHFASYYIRDRDFDYEPSGTLGPHEVGDGMGYRWSRHEIENYIIDPLIVVEATGLDWNAYQAALMDAGKMIQHYQASRWAIGLVRRKLPFPYTLDTRPDDIKAVEFRLPPALDRESRKQWALGHSETYKNIVADCLAQKSVEEIFEEKDFFFQSNEFMATENILLWFSGKDLLTSLHDWLAVNGMGEPASFRIKIRDWMQRNSPKVLALLPEWQRFIDILNQDEEH